VSKLYLRQMKLRRWFPPNDRFAVCVDRLSILREDFALEMWGVYKAHIRALDAHSAVWRKLYFWRNLVRTLLEIRKTLESLNTVMEFKSVLKKQPIRWQKRFRTMIGKLEKAEALVEEIRNSLGGHVLHESVEKALSNMSSEKFSYIEVGENLKRTHYNFAGELVGEILLAGVPEEEREAALAKQFETIAGLLPVFALTDIVFTMYADASKLHE
jgi:hypothetical protein